jgi:acylphosphatase
MNLQARKINGNVYTAEDVVEVNFTGNSKEIETMLYTIEVVSGVDVTHGGGAPSGEYLHYKSIERDVDSDGDIDYTSSEMVIAQLEKGESVVRIKGECITKLALDEYVEADAQYEETLASLTDLEEIEAHKSNKPTLIPEHLTSGGITLNWSDLEPYV